MPVVAAAICPHPPLILPSVASGASIELEPLRIACAAAVDRVFAADLDDVVIVGGGIETRRFGPNDFGSFDGFGVRDTYALGGRDALAVGVQLPLSLAVGAWLLRDRRTGALRRGFSVAGDTASAGCRSLGAYLAASPEAVGLIIMGDGSACRSEKAPGYADPRSEAFDASVAKALSAADPEALLALDAGVAAELLVAGRAPWQVLAGAALATGGQWHGEVLYDEAPYGVGYFAASWTRKGPE